MAEKGPRLKGAESSEFIDLVEQIKFLPEVDRRYYQLPGHPYRFTAACYRSPSRYRMTSPALQHTDAEAAEVARTLRWDMMRSSLAGFIDAGWGPSPTGCNPLLRCLLVCQSPRASGFHDRTAHYPNRSLHFP